MGKGINTSPFFVKKFCKFKVPNGSTAVIVKITKKILEFIFGVSKIHFFTNNPKFFIGNLVVIVSVKMPKSVSDFFEFLHQSIVKIFDKPILLLLNFRHLDFALKNKKDVKLLTLLVKMAAYSFCILDIIKYS
jgi:hypothetical protein